MSVIRIVQGVVTATSVVGPPPPPPPPPPPSYGSWTIEWWGKKLSPQTNGVPRVFAAGVDTGATIGFSNESGGDYVWTNGLAMGPITVGSITNAWHHWAIVSDGSSLTFYKDGVALANAARTHNAITTSSYDFNIGTDTSSAWKGRITDFHVIKGATKYTGNFTPPSSRISPQTGTQVLIYASGGSILDAHGAGTPTASNWVYSTDDPYGDGAGSIEFNGSNTILTYAAGISWLALDA